MTASYVVFAIVLGITIGVLIVLLMFAEEN